MDIPGEQEISLIQPLKAPEGLKGWIMREEGRKEWLREVGKRNGHW